MSRHYSQNGDREKKRFSRPHGDHRKSRWVRFLTDVALSMFLGVLLGVVVVYYMIGRVPEGFVTGSVFDAQAANRFISKWSDAVSRTRRQDEVTVTFTDKEISAILASLERDDRTAPVRILDFGKKIPPKIENIQVHITPDSFRLDCRYEEPWLRRPVLSAYLSVQAIDGKLHLNDPKIYAGSLPVKNDLLKTFVGAFEIPGKYFIQHVELGAGEITMVLSRRKRK